MKISVDLLNSYLKKPLKTEDMVAAIEVTEVEVEEILYANKLDNKIIVAKVLEASQHPNADRLKLVKVETDAGVVDVVCGAPNVKAGLIVALAQVGTILPSGDEIGEAKIRGEVSHGMLCSELELGWGDDHSGIVELDPNLPLGKSLCDIAISSDILDVKTPSNRWDYMSYIGLAREIAATQPDNAMIEPEKGEIAYQDREVVKVKETGECKVFISAKLSVKANMQSPRWLVDNLQAAGMRSINPVVDVTNFVMLEYGQPSHAYDSKKITGTLGVRFAKDGESLTTLDDKTIKLTKNDLVIVDNSGPVGLAGVMGGQKTETEANTAEIIVEVANFDKTTVRRSAMRHGLRTEASARFEKGLPLPLPQLAMQRIITLLKKVCDGEILDSPVYQEYSKYEQQYLGMRLRKAERFLGYKLDEKEVASVLGKRGFKPTHFSFSKEVKAHLGKKYMYGAQIATENLDKFDCSLLTQHIYAKAGVIIGRTAEQQYSSGMEVPDFGLKPGDLLFLYGDEAENGKKIGHVGMLTSGNKVLQASSTQKKVVLSPITKFTKAKNYAGARRYVENFNHIISVEVPWWRNDVGLEVDLYEEVAKSIGYTRMPENLPQLPPSDTTSHQLLPSFMKLRIQLAALGLDEVMTHSFVSEKDVENINTRLADHLQIENPLSSEQDYLRTTMLSSHLQVVANNPGGGTIFEISRVYHKQKLGANEVWKLAITVWGENSLLRVMGVCDEIWGWYKYKPTVNRISDKSYIAGRSAELSDGLGVFGQLSPVTTNSFGAKGEVAFAEIDLDQITQLQGGVKALAIPPYQLIRKDITVELPVEVLWQAIVESIGNNTEKLEFGGEFSNDELQEIGRKRVSMIVHFDLGPNPTSAEIQKSMDKCHKALINIKSAKVL